VAKNTPAKKNAPTQSPSDDDIAVNTLFREIDDDLRQDKAAQLWKRFGTPFIVFVVLAVASVGAFEAWSAYDRQNREALGDQFGQALTLIAEDKASEATEILDTLKGSETGYANLAAMQQAALLATQGDAQGAADAYLALADQGTLDPAQKTLAHLLGGLNALNAGNAARALEVLAPLQSGENALRHTAAELSAYAHAQQGDVSKAYDIMTQLSDDATVPNGLRARAREFTQVYAPR